MKIKITPEGVTLRLSFQEYAATAAALKRHAKFSKEADRIVRAGLPKIQDKGGIIMICQQCRANFPKDDVKIELIGSREERVDTCPECGSHYIQELRS